jgi:hypothetical protein
MPLRLQFSILRHFTTSFMVTQPTCGSLDEAINPCAVVGLAPNQRQLEALFSFFSQVFSAQQVDIGNTPT